jgi:hypothetical protein
VDAVRLERRHLERLAAELANTAEGLLDVVDSLEPEESINYRDDSLAVRLAVVLDVLEP